MSYRTLKLSVLVLGIVGGAVLLLPGAETKPAAPTESIAQLQQQIAKLEERVAQLELRSGRLARPVPHFRSVPDQSLPEGWRRQEFNGAPYYIVPLDGTRRGE